MAEVELVERKPSLPGAAFRAIFVTFLVVLLTFAVTLLLGIFGIVLIGAVRGQHPDMREAYRWVALPTAITVGAVVLVVALVGEIRRYRQRLAVWRGF